MEWKRVKEKAYLIKNKKKNLLLKLIKNIIRPLEIDYLKGNPKKAFKKLNYKLKHDLKDLVKDMIDSDIKLLRKNKMKKSDNIFIAGHNGLVGSAVLNCLKKKVLKI
jgi:GDPmannose 4,6-dehydratase